MIPLYVFLLAWLIFLVLYGVMALVSMLQFVRFGVAGTGTWLSTITFLVVALCVVFGTGWYLLGADWMQTLNLFGSLSSSVPLIQ